ncbi:MAG: 50S ribosomal protein L31 [Patescibacteria group bacterium]
MKQGIHPTYSTKATVTCVCGAVLTTGSTVEKMSTEICSNCHPFYTGKKKFIDAGGRVDRFKRLTAKATDAKKLLASKKKKTVESLSASGAKEAPTKATKKEVATQEAA